MTSAQVLKFAPVETRRLYECSACGASATASCDCNVPYVPAGTRAAAAVAANPDKSDRAIAAELGVGRMTVQRARKKSTVPHGTVEKTKRTGRDGRKRAAPKPKKAEDEVQRQASINIRPSDWAEFKRRADAHGQSAAATLGLLV